MSVTFDPRYGMTVQDTAVIRDAIRSDWIEAFAEEGQPTLNVVPESPAGQLIDSETVLVHAKDTEVLFLGNQFNPNTAEGIWQDALGKIYFQTRKINEPTVVPVICSGLYNTIIRAGAQVRTSEGDILISNGDAVIQRSGTVTVFFRTQDTGPIPVPAFSIDTPNNKGAIVTVIAGWDTAVNQVSGTLGRDVESRAEFEERRRNSVALNSRGSVASIYSSVSAVNGVLDCKVVENITDNPAEIFGMMIDGHSVGISVYGGIDTDIAEAIYLKKDGGCGTTGNTQVTHVATDYNNATYVYNIIRPNSVPFHIHLIMTATDDTASTVIEDLNKALIDEFNGLNFDSGNPRVGVGQRVFANRFWVAAVKTAHITNVISVQIGIGQTEITVYPDDPDQPPYQVPADPIEFVDYLDIDLMTEPVLEDSNITVEVQTIGDVNETAPVDPPVEG